MPHKRAKLSTRQTERATRGTDLPPMGGVSLTQESVPKSMARVLHAEGVRKAYNKKRALDGDALGAGTAGREPKRRKKDVGETQKQPVGIKHGESLAQYNRRVEEEMRIPVAEAMHSSRSTMKRARRVDAEAAAARKAAASAPAKPKPKSTPAEETPTSAPVPAHAPDTVAPQPARKTEFECKATTTRLNDIVQAPPNFTKLPRGAAKRKAQGGGASAGSGAGSGKADGVVSLAQKRMMEEEREKAIKRYRELKEIRAAA